MLAAGKARCSQRYGEQILKAEFAENIRRGCREELALHVVLKDRRLVLRKDRNLSSLRAGRRNFLRGSVAGGVVAAMYPALGAAREIVAAPPANDIPSFELDEVTIDDLQTGMKSGKYTARGIAEMYLGRIDAVDKNGPAVNSVIEINPDAVEIAESLDRERKQQGARGPLHGIPLLIKDNVDTADKMMTTAGSLALVGGPKPPRDSFVAAQLRKAGAVILGKTNLSEWANIRSSHSSSGWSGRGGLTRNPYALDRNPCGSSSGTGAGVSANFAVGGIGTETDGSIVCPSSSNGLAGIKPTVGLVSRAGIVPISHSQDTAGPMCRTLRDAAIMLGALTGIDPEDTATNASNGKSHTDYTLFLDAQGLRGARIGVARKYFGFSESVDGIMAEAIEVMKKEGATIVDPADIETFGKFDESESLVLDYELKADMAKYLARLGPASPMKTLKDLIDFNNQNAAKEMPYFGQDIFLRAERRGPLSSREYIDALEKNHRLTRSEGIDATMDKHKLDALIAPTGGPAWVTDLVTGDHFGGGSSNAAAVAGYPNINITAGYMFGLPVGISFFGRAWTEPTLLKIAYGFEQATRARQAPKFLAAADLKR
jgi:amidase